MICTNEYSTNKYKANEICIIKFLFLFQFFRPVFEIMHFFYININIFYISNNQNNRSSVRLNESRNNSVCQPETLRLWWSERNTGRENFIWVIPWCIFGHIHLKWHIKQRTKFLHLGKTWGGHLRPAEIESYNGSNTGRWCVWKWSLPDFAPAALESVSV